MNQRTTIPGNVHDLHAHLARSDAGELQRRVRSLAAQGMGDHDIAALLRLHVHYVHRILSTPAEQRE